MQKLHAFWAKCQGLDGSLQGRTAEETLERSGWIRSVGGSSPYLGIMARTGFSRAQIDHELANVRIHELPSARGCTYVLPAADFATGLMVAQNNGDAADLTTAIRFLGVTREEINNLQDKVLQVLQGKILTPTEIKKELGDAVRSLGEDGKKRGMTTTLGLAFTPLQVTGKIRRIPVNGRLDQQKYAYTAWENGPTLPSRAQAQADLARKFFTWGGPASLKHFRWFANLTVPACDLAIADLNLQPFLDTDLFALPEHIEQFEKFTRPDEPKISFVGSLDNISHLRGKFQAILNPEDAEHPVFTHSGLKPSGFVGEILSNAVIDRGTLIGLWDFDPVEGKLLYRTFQTTTPEVNEAAAKLEQIILADYGDIRTFSLDSPTSRKERLASLR